MVIMGTFKDKIEGQRKAAGKMIRKRIVLAVDSFNILVATSTGDSGTFAGRKFYQRLGHLQNCLEEEFGLNVEQCLKITQEAFGRLGGESMEGMSWVDLDEKFEISKRRPDSSGILKLYDRLREAGWKDDSSNVAGEKVELVA